MASRSNIIDLSYLGVRPYNFDVLARRASAAFEALTVQQAPGLSLPRPVARGSHAALPGSVAQAAGEADADAARRCARVLVSEIRMYNEPLVDAGYIEQELVRSLAGGDRTPPGGVD